MPVLNGLQPKRVFYYFEELCKIPHGSYHTKEISDYLVAFAKAHGLEYRQDESNNVVLKKPATSGYENAPTVILQGHSDMVCEKVVGSSHNFEKDGLELLIQDDYITANGTTLGGDDGIAVAYALAILENNQIKHPALEVLITTDEEVGLLGAKALDVSDLKGKYFINLDSEEEGKIWISCAGGLTAITEIPVSYTTVVGMKYELVIDGLVGGHSGAEIDKNRANSNKLMGRFLFELVDIMEYQLAELVGGQKDNAITRTTRAVIVSSAEAEVLLTEKAKSFERAMREEYRGSDSDITVTVRKLGEDTTEVIDSVSFQKILFYLVQVPFGVQKMSGEIDGLVETSINMGILELGEQSCKAISSIRSSLGSAKVALSDKVCYLTEFLGGTYTIEGDYPAWEYRKDSKLRDIVAQTYEDMFHKKPDIVAIHAGLECGIFYEKMTDLDCVSIGPDMADIHTTEERLFISSTERTWKLLLKILENIK